MVHQPKAGALLLEVDDLELTIEKLVAGGDGLGRYRGAPIFVPRSAPGDRLKVRIVERRPDYGRAEILEVLEPGPGRREAPCPYFSACGGCDLQHLEEGVQVRAKVQALLETLHRIGKLPVPEDLRIKTAEPFGYRLRTQLHIEPPAGDPESGARVGYFARGSHDLVPVEGCPILVPELEALLPELPALLAEGGPRRLDLAAGDAITSAPVVKGLPHGPVSLKVGEFDYEFDARCFFQGHRGLLGELVQEVVGPWEGKVAYDLYSGVGLFSLPLARRYEKVVAVEGDRIAARYAGRNARRAGADNLRLEAARVEAWLDRRPGFAERVVLDPPRGGLSLAVAKSLRHWMPERITYVSCHPAALARDLRDLTLSYRLESLSAFDLFPQTGHLEAVVQLVITEEAAQAARDEAEGRRRKAQRAQIQRRRSPRPSSGPSPGSPGGRPERRGPHPGRRGPGPRPAGPPRPRKPRSD